jgi:hypothetical protein
MLNKLFEMLQSIVPIKTLLDNNGIIIIEYFENNTPSESQILEINNIIDQWPLHKAKLEKIKSLDESWKLKLKNGWETPDGYSLGIDISDVALLNGVFTLAKEASLMGINNTIYIVDLDGISRSLSLQNLTILMLQYGQARASLSNSYAAIKQSINAATTIQELEAINTNI